MERQKPLERGYESYTLGPILEARATMNLHNGVSFFRCLRSPSLGGAILGKVSLATEIRRGNGHEGG